ncbi:MAG: pilus assembly protein N-terminal domain-containing protein [Planctomycetaceae bacterium]
MKLTLPGRWRDVIPAGLLTFGLIAGTDGRAQDPQPNALKLKVQELVDEVISAELEIEVPLRRSKILRMKQNIFRVAVADPEIVDFVAFGSREVELIGKERGSTSLTFWMGTEDDARILSMLVTVTADHSPEDQSRVDYGLLAAKINELFPDSRVQLIPIGQKLIVRGQTRDEAEASKVLSIVRSAIGSAGRQGIGGAFVSGQADFPEITGQLQPPSNLRIVNFLHVPGEKQVLLKVRIAELKRTADRSLGANLGPVNVSGTAGNSVREFLFDSVLGTATTAMVSGTFTDSSFNVALQALVKTSNAKILAEPNLVTLSGTTANFIVGGEFAVPTVVGVGGAQASTTEFKGFGTQLTFTPTVIDHDRIRLQVTPTVSEANGPSVNGIPGLSTRSAQTTVDLREGQVLAIAGLIQDTQAGAKAALPYLGEIPGLNLFTSTRSVVREETELIILVTPELVHAMEPGQAPSILPGMEVTEPNDLDLYLYGDIEGRNECHHRSTVWPLYKSRLKRCHGSHAGARSTGYFVHGDHGFSQ